MTNRARWNLNLLQTFALVAEHRSFRKAADESLRSQSAVSAQIKELERQIGVRLFDRTTRRVSLTAEGTELWDCTQRAFSEIAAGLDNVHRSIESKADKVRIACIPTITAGRLPVLLTEFERHHPNVQVLVREVNNEDVVSLVQKRDVDFGLGVTVPASECRFDKLLSDDMWAVVSKAAVPAETNVLPMEQLLDMPVFILPQATPTLIALQNEARRQGKEVKISNRFSQPQTAINMAAAGHGAAVLPGIFVADIDCRGSRKLKIVEPEITRELAIISHRGSGWTGHARALARTVRDVFSR